MKGPARSRTVRQKKNGHLGRAVTSVTRSIVFSGNPRYECGRPHPNTPQTGARFSLSLRQQPGLQAPPFE